MKIILLLFLFPTFVNAQYIAIKARYTATRLVDDFPNPPKRENRLMLSFYEVNGAGAYTPVAVTNYQLYVYKEGLQYGSLIGAVLDSAGNNYDHYSFTAPKAVSYYNSMGESYIDCIAGLSTLYVVNGHTLDCGWIGVSYWDIDGGTGEAIERFTAPNISLPYFAWPHPYFDAPGNINFWAPVPPTAPYNLYNFTCGTLQYVRRGVLQADTSDSEIITLPVRFANVNGNIDAANRATISWTNLTESNVAVYEIERSTDGINFQKIGTTLASSNAGGSATYDFSTTQLDNKNYYRIKAVEMDGTIYYSVIITISQLTAQGLQLFSIYPNPVTSNELNIRLENAEAGRYIFSVVSSSNQRLKQKMIIYEGGTLIRRIDLNLPPGLYTAILQSATQRFTKQIIITR